MTEDLLRRADKALGDYRRARDARQDDPKSLVALLKASSDVLEALVQEYKHLESEHHETLGQLAHFEDHLGDVDLGELETTIVENHEDNHTEAWISCAHPICHLVSAGGVIARYPLALVKHA